ncbi:MAG: Lrp/AsnC family transcriptional regulator [Leucobacter sp.]
MPADALSDLQRRIIAALQVDGRAPWRKIADALGEPERTVARYGNDLIESGRVVIAAVDHSEHSMILACKSAPGTSRLSGEALAQRDDVTFSYLTTGTADVVAEIGYRDNLGELLATRLPATAGVQSLTAMPILRYFKTIRGWRTGALTEAEEEALVARTGPDRTEWSLPESRGPKDDEIIGQLKADGRVSIEALARRAKMSETSVTRRVEWLLSSGQFSIRALVDPALVGFDIEAILWVRVASYRVEALGNELRRWPEVRYAAAIAGESQLIVNVTAASHHELYQLLAHSTWEEHGALVSSDLIVEARKRGGRAV